MSVIASQIVDIVQLFVQNLVQANDKETSVICINGLLCWKSTGEWWIPYTKGH